MPWFRGRGEILRRLAKLEGDIMVTQQQVDALTASVTAATTAISGLQTGNAAIATAITNLEAELAAVGTLTTAVATAKSNFDATVAGLPSAPAPTTGS